MNPLSFEEDISVKVTPNQIHKMMDKLKNAIAETTEYYDDESIVAYKMSKAQIVDTSIDELEDIYKNKFIDNFESRKLLYEYKKDLLSIKEALFYFNTQNQVSKKLSKIDTLKTLIDYYSIFKESITSSTNIKESLLKAKKFLENCDSEIQSVEISMLFYRYDEVKKLKSEVKSQILTLEKEITILNATEDITINISKNSAEYLGLR